jgi:hypothetical protein
MRLISPLTGQVLTGSQPVCGQAETGRPCFLRPWQVTGNRRTQIAYRVVRDRHLLTDYGGQLVGYLRKISFADSIVSGLPDGYPRQIQSRQSAENSHSSRRYAKVVYACKGYCRRSGYEQQAQGYQTDVAALAAARCLTPAPLAIPTSHHSSPLSRFTLGADTVAVWHVQCSVYGAVGFEVVMPAVRTLHCQSLSTCTERRQDSDFGHQRRRHWSWC